MSRRIKSVYIEANRALSSQAAACGGAIYKAGYCGTLWAAGGLSAFFATSAHPERANSYYFYSTQSPPATAAAVDGYGDPRAAACFCRVAIAHGDVAQHASQAIFHMF